MKKKKIIILIVLLITALIVAYLVFAKSVQNETLETNKTPEEVKQEVESIINVLVDQNVTKKELSKKIDKEVSELEIMQGNDSLLMKKPKNMDIEANKLSDYAKVQKEYASRVEQAIKNNLEITYTETEEVFDGRVVQHVDVLAYYYRLYVYDLSEITTRLLKYSGIDVQTLKNNKESEILLYKAKIKSMELMDDYLYNYENYEETKTFTMEYSEKSFSQIDITTLVMGINGALYTKTDLSKPENIEAQKKRVNMYINNAISEGTLDTSNPLKLK